MSEPYIAVQELHLKQQICEDRAHMSRTKRLSQLPRDLDARSLSMLWLLV